jgi:hypothetical protein
MNILIPSLVSLDMPNGTLDWFLSFIFVRIVGIHAKLRTPHPRVDEPKIMQDS